MTDDYCYVAKREGEPGAYAACVDDGKWPAETAKFCADIVSEGGYVERVATKDVSDLLKEWSRWNKGVLI